MHTRFTCVYSKRLFLYLLCGAVVLLSCAIHAQEVEQVVVSPMQPYLIPSTAKTSNDVLTQRNNNQRTGAVVWSGLNQSSFAAGHFGLIGKIGGIQGVVLSQPLFMESVKFPDGVRSVVFIATSKNWVYAFEADPPFRKRWEINLGPPYALPNAFNAFPNECAVQMAATQREVEAATPNLKETREIGIESTPVIDRSLNRMIVSYRKACDNGDHTCGRQRIAALDLVTGRIIHDRGNPLDREVSSDSLWNRLHRNRSSLLVSNGFVFLGFSALCEGFSPPFDKSYQGWIYTFDAKTLDFAGRYRSMQSASPQAPPSNDPMDGGGIWMASTGLAADGSGTLFFSTGNGRKSPANPDPAGLTLSSSAIRLSALRDGEPGHLPRTIHMQAGDWFTPSNKLWQDRADMDLGSGGVLLIPGTPYLAMGGKEGILYLLDRGNLGKFDATRNHVVQELRVGFNQYCSNFRTITFCTDTKTPPGGPITQPTPNPDDWLPWPHIHGTPVFGRFNDGRAFLYIWPEKDHLKSFEWKNDRLDLRPTVATAFGDPGRLVLAPPFLRKTPGAGGMPGGMLSLTIDPTGKGQGVLFASVQRCRGSNKQSERFDCSMTRCNTPTPAGDPEFGVLNAPCVEQDFGMLRAFDPITLRELWNNQIDTHASDADKDYWFAKWVPPTIAKGKVFLATGSEKVLVYGKF